MRSSGTLCRLSVMNVTAEGAEAAEDSPTVHVPLLVQSSAPSASSAVNFVVLEMPRQRSVAGTPMPAEQPKKKIRPSNSS